MSTHRRPQRSRGFTIVEALIVVAVIGIAVAIGIPTMQRLLHRTKMENVARETAMLMQQARYEAIKRGVPVVVRIDPTTREVITFADVHGGLDVTLPSDGLFAAIPGAAARTTDYELGRLLLPPGVDFVNEAGQTDLASIDGFSENDDQGFPNLLAVFLSDGSIADVGAFRFGDDRGNYLEARVDPQGTARVEVRKWDDVDGDWYGFGEGGKPWNWE